MLLLLRRFLLLTLLLGAVVLLTSCGERALLSDVRFSHERITPNADFDTDILRIQYHLSRSATLSIYFIDEEGNRYFFREQEPRAPSAEDPYSVYFAGVVDGYTLPGEEFEDFRVTHRMLQDGEYTWVVEATDEMGHSESATGALTIADADIVLPEINNFTIAPPIFTPNRDGIEDRAYMNLYLPKDVEELIIYMVDEDDEERTRYHVAESSQSPAEPRESGQHLFDYDAGVDLGADPPPDGTYTVWVEAQDRVGQHTVASGTLTIQNGGVPRAYLYNAEVEWSATSIVLGETLYFTLTVENDSIVPIRTSGPPPGTIYDSDQNFATLGEATQSGVFRVGIHCENAPINYPWRWSVGREEDLVQDAAGHSYLPPGRSVISGGIRFVDVLGARNPQYCWAGLIHEDVQIAAVNTHVDPVHLTIHVP